MLRWRSRDIYGIMNGIDESLFDPATDKAIYANYSIDDMSGKAKCKESIRTEFWLDKDASPIIGMVTRFTDQKGLDLVEYAMENMLRMGMQVVILGNRLRSLAGLYPAVSIPFNMPHSFHCFCRSISSSPCPK